VVTIFIFDGVTLQTSHRKLLQTPQNPPKTNEICQMDNSNQAGSEYFLYFIF